MVLGAGQGPGRLTDIPYPGLRSFRRDEGDIFFGREEQVDRLLEKLERHRFLCVVGASGCGKSSLVRAGMLPALDGGLMVNAGPRWLIAEMRPGLDPFSRLADALLTCGLLSDEWRASSAGKAFVVAALRRGQLGLVELTQEARIEEGINLLLLVDQFEEIFRFKAPGPSSAATAFVDLLLESSAQAKAPIHVVITMRSDFLGQCASFVGLPEAINEGQFLTPRLSREGCRAAILGPAVGFGGDVEANLVNRLLNEMGSTPDQLPLMQHALRRMWISIGGATVSAEVNNPQTRGGRPTLTLAAYEALGGLENALSKHAEEVLLSLDSDEQALAQVLFRSLVERSNDQRDTRRPALARDIAAVAGRRLVQVVRVVDAFRQVDCCFLVPSIENPIDAATLIDVTHEALVRQWRELRQWVNDEFESAVIYRRLSETALLWKKGDAALWTTPDLELALSWRDRERPTEAWAQRYGGGFPLSMEFLERSTEDWERRREAEHDRRQRELEMSRRVAAAEKHRADEAERRQMEQKQANKRLRRRAIIATSSSVLALSLSVAVLFFFLHAQRARRFEEAARIEAERRGREADASKLVAEDALRREQAALARSEAARQAAETLRLVAEAARSEEGRQRGRAETALEEAETARERMEAANDALSSFRDISLSMISRSQSNLRIFTQIFKHDRELLGAVLRPMIDSSESMSDEERQYWRNVLPVMSIEHTAELFDILGEERRKLWRLEASHEPRGYEEAIEEAASDIETGEMIIAEARERRGRAYYSRGTRLLAQGDLPAALADFTGAIQEDPSNAAYIAARARTHQEAGTWERALIDYTRAIELDPENAVLFRGRGDVNVELGALDQGKHDLERALSLSSQDSFIVIRLAALELLRGDKESFRTTVRSHSCDVVGDEVGAVEANNRAWLSLLVPDETLSLFRCKELVDLAVISDPASVHYLHTKGALLYRLGDYTGADRLLTELITGLAESSGGDTSFSTFMRAYSAPFIAMAHSRLGSEQKAREWLQIASDALTRLREDGFVESSAGIRRIQWNQWLQLESLLGEAAAEVEEGAARKTVVP